MNDMTDMTDQTTEMLPSIKRLSRDMGKAAGTLDKASIPYCVFSYYTLQEFRIGCDAQVRELQAAGKPKELMTWLAYQAHVLEQSIRTILSKWVANQPEAEWALSVHGIGPVIAAGLISQLDIKKAPTAGHFWAFAGYDPSKKWEKGKKRPHNAALKRICFLAGNSFEKFQADEKCYYGHRYKEWKASYWRRNLAREFSERARQELASKKWGAGTEAIKWLRGDYASADLDAKPPKGIKPKEGETGFPMLRPDHIRMMALRKVIKLFLAHLHDAMYQLEYGKPTPRPYVVEHGGHTHVIERPIFS